jgi:uncharacterized membrane protein (Fun14 family)
MTATNEDMLAAAFEGVVVDLAVGWFVGWFVGWLVMAGNVPLKQLLLKFWSAL